MRVLITGSNGFLGSVLVEKLVAAGDVDVRCLVRSGSDLTRLQSVRARYSGERLELFVGSLASASAAAEALEGVDLVYHLAAGLKGTAADLILNSVVTSRNLMDAVKASGRSIKVVLVSSFGVYGVAGLKPGSVVDESTPLEANPTKRDLYSYSKLRQEQLMWEYHEKHGVPLVVVRPGAIYGPHGGRFSGRVGLSVGPLFLHLGGRNPLPLTYVENCADAIIAAGRSEASVGQVFNVVDDELPNCRQYLACYRKEVQRLRVISLPYFVTMGISRWMERYHHRSKGQLPAALTPYKTASIWKANRFDNSKLKSIGWSPAVPTTEGIRRTFAYFRTADESGK